MTLLQLSPVVMGFPHLLLAFPVADFTGYMGGVICAPGGPCGGVSNLTDGVHFDTLASGTLTPAAAPAPEASPGWDLAIGVAALAVARIRVLRRTPAAR